MKCELCHNADAEKAIIKKVGGQEQELYVCSSCAIDTRLAGQEKSVPKKPGKMSESLPELVGMIIDATLEIMNHPAQPKEPVCPHCGITRSEFRKASRLGCAMCYETFAKDLGSLIADMHRDPQHVGKTPVCPTPSKEVKKLMRQLRTAERKQCVDDAVALRSAIRSLGWEPDSLKEEV